jgi:hypothetical protein
MKSRFEQVRVGASPGGVNLPQTPSTIRSFAPTWRSRAIRPLAQILGATGLSGQLHRL